MFEVVKSLQVSGSVLALKISPEKIFTLTNQYLYIVYDKKSLTVLDNKKISNKFENKYAYDKSFAISSKSDFFITTTESLKSHLMKYGESLSNVATIELNKKAVYCSSFNHAGDILAIGGEDGKLFFYSLKDKKTIKSLPTQSDFISNITFSKDDKLVAVSSFNKKTIIYSCDKASEIAVLQCSEVVEASIFIDNNSKLLTVTRDKKYTIHSIRMGIEAKYSFEFREWPTALIDINEKYSVVGDRGNSLYIINHQKGTILTTIGLDNKGIVSLKIESGRLYVAFVDGEIKIIDINSNLDKFTLNLKLKNFVEASKLIEKNIFLATNELTAEFDKEWIDVLSNAKKLLVAEKRTEAEDIVKPFFFDIEKKDEFIFCLGNLNHFKDFSILIEEKNYPEAFKLADKYEFLKKTKDFEAIEKYFFNIFQHCKQLFTKNDPQGIESAKKILATYSQVPSKRILVNNLMIRYKIFILAEKFIKERNFKEYCLLVQNNPFLKDEEIYNRVITIGNNTLNHLNIYQQEQNYPKALEVAHYLQDFLSFKNIIDKKIESIAKYEKLLHKIEDKNLHDTYKIIKEDSQLEIFPPFLTLHEEFLELKEEAHQFANAGDATSMLSCLNPYLNIDYTLDAIAQEFKLAYLAQIKVYLTDSIQTVINWKETFVLYSSFFGIDNELLSLLDGYKFDGNFTEQQISQHPKGYKENNFVESVIVLNI